MVINTLSEGRQNRVHPYVDKSGCMKFRRTQSDTDDTKRAITLSVYKCQPESTEEKGWSEDPHGLNKIIQTLFPEPIHIDAMEDAGEDVSRSKRGSTISRLIGEVLDPSNDDIGSKLSEPLSTLRESISSGGSERLSQLDSFDEKANDIISDFFPGLEIRTHIPVPNIEDIFGDGTIRVVEGESEEERDVSSLGHGAQRSIQMALIRHLAEQRMNEMTTAVCKLVFIDEPELYLHPQAVETVRRSLKDLSEESYQVVFATHSPLMIGEKDIPYATVVQKKKQGATEVRPRVAEAVKDVIDDAESQKKTLFNLNNASRILFADRVLVMEGKAEKRLLPRIFEAVKGKTLREEKVALISVNSASSIPKSVKILKTMGMEVQALVDLDFAFNLASTNELINSDDIDLKACFAKHPGNSGNLHSADQAKQLAESGVATDHIDGLHKKLKDKDYWLWTNGDLEDHLGLPGKSESIWINFIDQMDSDGFDEAVEDSETVRNLINWIGYS